jgi:hypothetical protein
MNNLDKMHGTIAKKPIMKTSSLNYKDVKEIKEQGKNSQFKVDSKKNLSKGKIKIYNLLS